LEETRREITEEIVRLDFEGQVAGQLGVGVPAETNQKANSGNSSRSFLREVESERCSHAGCAVQGLYSPIAIDILNQLVQVLQCRHQPCNSVTPSLLRSFAPCTTRLRWRTVQPSKQHE
jgi:hypothetical protein